MLLSLDLQWRVSVKQQKLLNSYRTDREQAFKQPIYVNESRNRRGERTTLITGGNTIVDRDFCEINVEFDRSREIQS